MAAGDRAEAFQLKELDAKREEYYYRQTVSDVGFITKLMLRLRETSSWREAYYKEHLEEVAEKAAKRLIFTSLPVWDAEAEATRAPHNVQHAAAKAREAAKPRPGTMAHMLREYGA